MEGPRSPETLRQGSGQAGQPADPGTEAPGNSEPLWDPAPETGPAGRRWTARLFWLSVVPPLVLIGVLLKSGTGAGAGVDSEPPPNAVSSPYKFSSGSPAPDFTVETLDGRTVSLMELRGQKVLLNFWATWCVPCRSEMPDIERLYQERKDAGFTVLAVDLEEGRIPVRSFVEKFGLTFPVGLDTRGEVAREYGVQSLPTTFFIDPEGRVASFNIGALNHSALARRLDAISP